MPPKPRTLSRRLLRDCSDMVAVIVRTHFFRASDFFGFPVLGSTSPETGARNLLSNACLFPSVPHSDKQYMSPSANSPVASFPRSWQKRSSLRRRHLVLAGGTIRTFDA
ncbi:hypothetical protein AK812_SmicGene9453 [Symbiodinium microadriaticum]|uniref:Uncharacterized protein n=1 Tax=Symbiodinium microadriaticum TaxID=2951 RepID=A0A1Q9EII5_SYMMI|nr:hypothetical protein AK812_SmicGene9453 [Symbiodinium microadriaticum]